MEYAALVSLLHVTDEILDFDDSELRFFPFTKEKIESFKEIIDSLLAFLDKFPPICSRIVQDLLTEIRVASYEAEDILESLIATHFLQKDGRDSHQRFPESSFEQIVEKLESINIEVWKIQPDGRIPALDNDMEMQLMEQLVGGCSELVVISIVGMGGLGKTTLARTLYDSQLVKETFDIRGWGTISQTYVVREIVENILRVIGVPLDGRQDVEQYLYQTLRDRKYLIVLDDIWDKHACYVIKRLLPENNNGSRIILTTRLCDVAEEANSSRIYRMELRSMDWSWSLFCQVVFGKTNCPPELVEIGKEITRLCRGVPLLISAIGGHLKKEEKTKENWKYISESTSVSKTDWDLLTILTLICNFLPHHMKALFLYFGSFQEDHPIDVFTIVNMWIAEGFVEPSRSKSMEEVAKEYLADMIDRNLVFVDDWDSLGNVKTCGIHDLFRDICIREAEKEKFFNILNRGIPLDQMEIYSQRRMILSQNIEEDVDSACSRIVSRDGSLLATRSFIFHGDRTFSSTIKLAPGLLKVLKISVKSLKFPVEILELVNLKYLQLGYVSEKIPSSISRLRNLQTFIATCVGAKQDLPSEIWEMLQLRHIVTPGFYLPLIPDVQSKGINIYGLKNLSTLKEMPDSSCTQEVLVRIPNVKKLYIFYTMPFDCSNNLVSLCKLESLHCVFKFKDKPNDNILRNNFFPVSLKKLVLRGCRIPWENLSIIGTLPNLEVLKLKYKAMVGTLWETNDGEFKQLRTLSIEESELEVWNTEVDHFPRLKHLKLEFCSVLEAIPSEIGEILTLETIELTKCSRAAESSVKKMLGEDNEIKISIISNDDDGPGYGSSSSTSSNNSDTIAQDLSEAIKEIII